MASARRIYRLNFGLGLLGLAAVVLGLAAAARSVDFGSASFDRLAAACSSVVPGDLNGATLLVLVFAALGAVVLLRGLLSAAHELLGQRRVLKRLQRLGDRQAMGERVTVVAGTGAQAFCAGYLRPRVYLSEHALDALSAPELRAVVAHERHHARRRDPLRLLVVRVLSDALFFLPALRRLTERYEAMAELAADEAAIREVGDRSLLASAMLLFGTGAGAERAVVGIAPERVDHLLGEPVGWRLPASVLAGALVTVGGLGALAAVTQAVAGGSGVALPVLMAQACMTLMTIAPIAIAVTVLVAGRRVWRGRGSGAR